MKLNDFIKEKQICNFCGNPKSYVSFKLGYSQTCGNSECKIKLFSTIKSNGFTKTKNKSLKVTKKIDYVAAHEKMIQTRKNENGIDLFFFIIIALFKR